ncbi:isoleucyl-tRNA synthetase like protein [Zymoseptoria brevis]|uniref:Isoleucyl-tRNA synthetase like protein n=1 Tax=Zymoseptoria brevis TaxID=1047168 RepID=A0A0F4GL35_9PEZI|nr:isoleucyl-tRNA synthetase like protein [Zymoseptoria brevis]
MASDLIPVVPGQALGFITLGSSLQEVLSTVKEDKVTYPSIDISFSQSKPLAAPVIVSLPENGIRLRFDGSDQRLRLIEVLDFTRAQLGYKGSEIAKKQDEGRASFKRIYQLFGASYPGEYIPPPISTRYGTYVLSWAGVAFNFPLQHSAWAREKDHVSMLGSQAAQPATHMALFEGNSWTEARGELFVKEPSGPRTAAIMSQPRDALPAELDLASVPGSGRIVFARRPPALPFELVIGQTTPQDLLTELGPPDATHKRDTAVAAEPRNHDRRRSSNARSLGNGYHTTPPSSLSSTGTDTFDTDFDSGDAEDDSAERAGREVFWCYFSHGLDILVGPPTDTIHSEDPEFPPTPVAASAHLVVLKVTLHGNIPGSYSFNRHRRLRWALELRGASTTLTSEHVFEDIKPDLLQAFHGVWPDNEMSRGRVVNRTWGGSPTDSSFFLPDADEDLVESGGGSESWLGNTKLYSFPGLTFEVSSNGAISALTVS